MNNLAVTAHREQLQHLTAAMQETGQTVELTVEHYFSNKTYVREMVVPKGVALVGKIHRYECTNILAAGKMRIVTEEGRLDISAPYTYVSGPGVTKAMYALEDSVFINVHPWDGHSTEEEMEERLIVPSYEALQECAI